MWPEAGVLSLRQGGSNCGKATAPVAASLVAQTVTRYRYPRRGGTATADDLVLRKPDTEGTPTREPDADRDPRAR